MPPSSSNLPQSFSFQGSRITAAATEELRRHSTFRRSKMRESVASQVSDDYNDMSVRSEPPIPDRMPTPSLPSDSPPPAQQELAGPVESTRESLDSTHSKASSIIPPHVRRYSSLPSYPQIDEGQLNDLMVSYYSPNKRDTPSQSKVKERRKSDTPDETKTVRKVLFTSPEAGGSSPASAPTHAVSSDVEFHKLEDLGAVLYKHAMDLMLRLSNSPQTNSFEAQVDVIENYLRAASKLGEMDAQLEFAEFLVLKKPLMLRRPMTEQERLEAMSSLQHCIDHPSKTKTSMFFAHLVSNSE